MKCEKCGNNVATFHYQSIINGEREEYHLCETCAKEEGFEEMMDFRQHAMAMCSNIMRQPFGSLLQSFWNEPFGMLTDSMFGRAFWPTLAAPGFAERKLPENEAKAATVTPEPVKDIPKDAGEAFRKKRELYALKHQMREAVRKEEFEKAAELRDKIHALENAQ
ncbi:MAG: UvrB/UvrC motif-containing protein [Oscillospiraceae bacterium]